MLRHALAMQCTTWTVEPRLLPKIDSAWSDAEALQLNHPTGYLGRFRLACDGRTLEIAGDIVAPAGWRFTPRADLPAWYLHDHVVVFLDPAHDHTTQRMLAVMRNGRIERRDLWTLNGEEVSDIQSTGLDLPPLRPKLVVREEPGGGWRFRLRVPIAGLRRQPGVRFPAQPMGIRLKLGVAGPTTFSAPAWPATDPFWKDNPFGFADLYATAAHRGGVQVEHLDFGRPIWTVGAVRSTVKLTARVGDGIVGGKATVRIVDPLGKVARKTVAWKAVRGQVTLVLPTDYPFTAKWAPNILRIARIGLDLHDRRGRLLWTATYPFGFDAGILVREPFGQMTGRAAQRTRPQPGDRRFVDRYRAWLLTKLPAWQWQTTRDGAPSDFFLRAPGHGLAARRDDLNLMSPSVFTDLARILHRHFSGGKDAWQDGLCAAAMALHHPCLTVHSASWARVATNAHTDTVLRLGGCFCSDCARIAGRLAEELGALYGVPLKGFDLGLHGHLTGLVETPLGEVLIDPMLGIYYHSLDNRRLATLDEMRRDKRIQLRMWSLAFNHGHEFFHKRYNQTKSPWLDGPLQYPPEC